MSETEELGSVTETFAGSSAEMIRGWSWLVAAAVAGVLFNVLVPPHESIPPEIAPLIGIGLGAFFCVITCFWLVPAIMRTGQNVEFHEHGLVFSRKGIETRLKYADVTGVEEELEMHA